MTTLSVLRRVYRRVALREGITESFDEVFNPIPFRNAAIRRRWGELKCRGVPNGTIIETISEDYPELSVSTIQDIVYRQTTPKDAYVAHLIRDRQQMSLKL